MNRVRQHRDGFTLAELLLAITISGVIAAAVAAMIYAVSYGTTSQRDLQSILVENDVAGSRINALVRPSRQVLASGANYLVLWLNDADGDSQAAVSELCRIEYDQAHNSLYTYRAPANVAPNTIYPIATTDFAAVTSAIKGTASFPQTLLASDITGVTFTLDDADPKLSALVTVRITTTINKTSGTTVVASAMRNR